MKNDEKELHEWMYRYADFENVSPLFLADYNSETYNALTSFFQDGLQSERQENLLTVFFNSIAGNGLTTMMWDFQKMVYRVASKNLLYITSEAFVDMCIDYVRRRKLKQFEVDDCLRLDNVWRKFFIPIVDGVIIDDVEFILGKCISMQALHSLTDYYCKNRKTVVLTLHCMASREFENLDIGNKQLQSRILQGICIDMREPCHKDKEEFIQYYLEKCNICLSDPLSIYRLRQYNSIRLIKDIINAMLFYAKDENKKAFSNNEVISAINAVMKGTYYNDELERWYQNR